MSEPVDIIIAKLTKRQAEGLLHACSPKYAPDCGHTSAELWDNGDGVGGSVLEVLARRGLMQRVEGRPIYWLTTDLGRRVAARLREAAIPEAPESTP